MRIRSLAIGGVALAAIGGLIFVGIALDSGTLLDTAVPDGARIEAAAPVGFAVRTAGWVVAGRVVRATAEAVELELRIEDTERRPAPEDLGVHVVFDMAAHGMVPAIAQVQHTGAGVYRVSAAVGMTGSWRAWINLPDGTVMAAVEVGK